MVALSDQASHVRIRRGFSSTSLTGCIKIGRINRLSRLSVDRLWSRPITESYATAWPVSTPAFSAVFNFLISFRLLILNMRCGINDSFSRCTATSVYSSNLFRTVGHRMLSAFIWYPRSLSSICWTNSFRNSIESHSDVHPTITTRTHRSTGANRRPRRTRHLPQRRIRLLCAAHQGSRTS